MADTFFIDTPSSLLDPRGIPYPACWTEEVEVTPATETEPAVTETRLKATHQAYPWTPAVIGMAFGSNVYFDLGDAFTQDYRDAGLYLAGSYYELSALHPDIAVNCTDAEYTLDGEPGRCKVADLPLGATVTGIFAPVKYLGVEAPTNPPAQESNPLFPTAIKEISTADSQLIQMKEVVKSPAISWIKEHPECTDAELTAWVRSEYGDVYAGIAVGLVAIYMQGAFEKGLVADDSWETFRDWVVATPADVLNAF